MKKNILIFSSTFPRWESDPVTARFVLDLAMELTADFNVFVLTPHAPNAQRTETWGNLQIIRFPYFYPLNLQTLIDGTGMISRLQNSLLAKLQAPLFLVFQALALYKTIKKHQIDVVNSHWMIPQGFTAALFKKLLGFKHIVTIHAADIFALRRAWFGRQIASYITKRTDTVYCVSSYNHSMLADLLKFEVPSRVLPMGIHSEFYKPKSDPATARNKLGLGHRKTILYVGKLSEKKGVTYLLQAFDLLNRGTEDAQLIIVGGGFLEKTLKEEAHRLGLDNKVVFAGYQTKENIRAYYQACDVVVIPSIIDARGETEGLPVVLLEALASGKPVVGTRVGGMPDLIREGENGFLVDPADPKGLAEKLKLALEKEPDAFAQNALKSAQKYDWRQIGDDYRNVITSYF